MKFSLLLLIVATLAYASAAPAAEQKAKPLSGYYPGYKPNAYESKPYSQYNTYKAPDTKYSSIFKPTYAKPTYAKPSYAKPTYNKPSYDDLEKKLNISVARQQLLCDYIESQAVDIRVAIEIIDENLDLGQVYTYLEAITVQCAKIKLQVKKARRKTRSNLIEFVNEHIKVQNETQTLIENLQRLGASTHIPASLREYVEHTLYTMITQATELKHEGIKQLESIFKKLAKIMAYRKSSSSYGSSGYGSASSNYGSAPSSYGSAPAYKKPSYPPSYGRGYNAKN